MKKLLLLAGAAVAAAILVRWQLVRWFTEEPVYERERTIQDVEIRRYPALVRATTHVQADSWKEALDRGFRRLAGYIFGGNRSRAKIPMTAPVLQEPERLGMTVPVTAEPEGGEYVVAFIMPPERTLESLPAPNDPSVKLEEVPPRRVAALRYSGGRSPALLKQKSEELLGILAREGLRTAGAPEYAGYDPPWTLPLLRRNEVWVELAD